MQLSQHFTLEDFLRSDWAARHGIVITAPAEVRIALTALVTNVLQPLRNKAGRPIIVTSGYRPPVVNKGIGGASPSQHERGEAADCRLLGVSNYTFAQMVMASGLPFDQLILEFDEWVHISHKAVGDQRGQVLTAKHIDGKVHYLPGLVK